MKTALAAALWMGSLALAATAQTSPVPQTVNPPTVTFQAGSEEVVLDVVVRDKRGRPVKDLKPDDFTITDNGSKRSIKSFRLVEGTEVISSSGTRSQLDPLRQIRLITLIFDRLSQDGRRLSRDAGMSLIKSELGPNVYLAVMAIDHKLEVLQPFTNDRDLLKKAIDRGTGGASDFTADTLRVRAQLEQMLGPSQGGGQNLADRVAGMSNGAASASGPGAAPNGAAAANAAMAQMVLHIVNVNQEDAATDYGRADIFALLTAVKEQYRLPGRKSILYFSEGFSIPQGMEEPFESVVSVANRANVSFYAVDSRGLSTQSLNQGAVDMAGDAASASKANATASSGS